MKKVYKRREKSALNINQKAYRCNKGGTVPSQEDGERGKGHTIPEMFLGPISQAMPRPWVNKVV